MSKILVKVVYTNRVLSSKELGTTVNLKRYSFLIDMDSYPANSIQLEDLIESPMYNNPMQIVHMDEEIVEDSEGIFINNIKIKELVVDTVSRKGIKFQHYNYKPNKVNSTNQTNKAMSSKKSMFSGFMEKYKSQFIPKKDYNLLISIDGTLCLQSKGEFIGITKDNTLVSYPEEMLMKLPVYTINKPYNKIEVGDIIKNNNTYSKVLKVNKNGSLQCLNFTGTTNNSKEIKDFILGSAFVEVVINMFAGMGNNEMNPMMMAMMSEDVDMKDIMMIQMMQGNSNMGNMNPMMLMALSEDGEKNSMVEMMMMSQMMGGTNPFMGMNTNKEEK